jgi:predicted O-methyltransferase YrrM
MSNLLWRIRHYLRETRKLSASGESHEGLLKVLSRFATWNRSFSTPPLDDQIPWVNYTAIDMLRRILRPDMRVFEYGTGGSTLFFARRTAVLVSVEHDSGWTSAVREAMKGNTHCAWEMLDIQPTTLPQSAPVEPADPATYTSALDAAAGLSFRDYASAIDRFEDGSFDLVLVDGRARPSCAMHAIPKVAAGGFLLVDDVEREHYAWIRDRMKELGWERTLLTGPRPRLLNFHQTAIWRRPDSAL